MPTVRKWRELDAGVQLFILGIPSDPAVRASLPTSVLLVQNHPLRNAKGFVTWVIQELVKFIFKYSMLAANISFYWISFEKDIKANSGGAHL